MIKIQLPIEIVEKILCYLDPLSYLKFRWSDPTVYHISGSLKLWENIALHSGFKSVKNHENIFQHLSKREALFRGKVPVKMLPLSPCPSNLILFRDGWLGVTDGRLHGSHENKWVDIDTRGTPFFSISCIRTHLPGIPIQFIHRLSNEVAICLSLPTPRRYIFTIDLQKMMRLDVFPISPTDRIIIENNQLRVGDRKQWSAEKGFYNIDDEQPTFLNPIKNSHESIIWDGNYWCSYQSHLTYDCGRFNIMLQNIRDNGCLQVKATDKWHRINFWNECQGLGLYVDEAKPCVYQMETGPNRLHLVDDF